MFYTLKQKERLALLGDLYYTTQAVIYNAATLRHIL